MPNITRPAPPRTNCGMEATRTAIFGTMPNKIKMTPEAMQTQRLCTRVTLTRPTFWENEVWGKLLNNPPIIVPTPSTRRPRMISCDESLRPTISPSARNMPIDSINTMINTAVMVRIDTGSKPGVPKAIGVTIANHEAPCRPDKFTSFIIHESAKPKMIPSSTATLDMKPLANRVINRIKIKTANEIPK